MAPGDAANDQAGGSHDPGRPADGGHGHDHVVHRDDRLLAHGFIAVAGQAFPIVSPFIGLLGCFITGSNTNANFLFGALQRDVAILLRESPAITAALQTTGASLGSMIAPAKVLVVCATAGLQGKEGDVMRVALKYCIPMTLLMGLLGWFAILMQ